MTKQAFARKNNLPSRILSAIVAIACIVGFIAPIQVILPTRSHGFGLAGAPFFKVLSVLFKSNIKVFDFIPSFAGSSAIGMAATASLYLFPLCLITAFVFAIVAIILRDKADLFARLATLIFTWGAGVYAITIAGVSCYVTNIPASIDLLSSILTAVGTIIYFALMCLKLGKKAIINGVQFLLSVGAFCLVVFAFADEGHLVFQAVNSGKAYKILSLALLASFFILLILGSIAAMKKKNNTAELVRLIAQSAIIVALVYFSSSASMSSSAFIRYSMEAAAVSLLQLSVLCVLYIHGIKKSEKEKVKTFISGFEKEEFVEVYAYDGSPVESVVMAEAETPVEETKTEEPKVEVKTVYDFSNRPFDPFINTLTEEEKTIFIELYVLKCKTPMPEIPAYVVGGNNKLFFQKVFIYLGQYRNLVPSSLLSKMYTYSIKI